MTSKPRDIWSAELISTGQQGRALSNTWIWDCPEKSKTNGIRTHTVCSLWCVAFWDRFERNWLFI